MRRILTAAVLVPILWLVIHYAPLWLFTVLFGAGITVGVLEIYAMFGSRGAEAFRVVGAAAIAALCWSLSGLPPAFDPFLPLAAAAVITLVAAIWFRDHPNAMLDACTATLFPVVAVGLPLAYMVALRAVPGETGKDLLILLLVCVTFSDTGAYYVGRSVGRTRMAPRLSPKKSWEGVAGGLAAAVGGGVLGHLWFFRSLPLAHAVALGLVLGFAGMLGDLAESMMKRASGTKDSSRLLPGHGGLMDRLDSLMLSSPVLYYYYRYLLEGSL